MKHAHNRNMNLGDSLMVVHWSPSLSLEAYPQECGRGGRNGLTCVWVMFVSRCSMDLMQTSVHRSGPQIRGGRIWDGHELCIYLCIRCRRLMDEIASD